MLTNTKIQDMVSTSTLLEKTNMMSVNQMNGQIKIQEVWKSLNIPHYPIQIAKQTVFKSGPSTRACPEGRLIESGNSCLSQRTCLNDEIESGTKCQV